MTDDMNDRRTARRFHMALPLQVRYMNNGASHEESAQTRDVSFRGVYFLTDTPVEAGSPLELVLTLPQQITLAGDVRIRCFGNVIRVEERENQLGVALRIDRYEFLPAAA
ncbi:MAG TPA: PilZ domain-containing protein [Candidatus Acidoferrales bacterium]|nr:PilZ domain-containing protein [Candidatus Acidoferrales bacterium]HEV2490369.1 PilZ domain-containing protein [Candidatus Acidoferrales bacterium]